MVSDKNQSGHGKSSDKKKEAYKRRLTISVIVHCNGFHCTDINHSHAEPKDRAHCPFDMKNAH